MPATRMTWTRDDLGRFRSGCGRFVVGGNIWSRDGSVYVRLFDAATGKEYPCRTVASAKHGAKCLAVQAAAYAPKVEG